MPTTVQEEPQKHTEEMQEIIGAPPAWLLRWGISLFLGVLVMIVGLGAFIRYPDVVKTQLKITAANPPQAVFSKSGGILTGISVQQNQQVKKGQILAYLETTASHEQAVDLLVKLKTLQGRLSEGKQYLSEGLHAPEELQLGEIEPLYRNFYQSWQTYRTSAAIDYQKKKPSFQASLKALADHRQRLILQEAIQEKEYEQAMKEYDAQKTGGQAADIKLFSKQYRLQLTESALLADNAEYSSREKEMMELDIQSKQEELKFMQVLNLTVNEMENWASSFILRAPQEGKVVFVGMIKKGQYINPNEELFHIEQQGSTAFFGEMPVPQANMTKVKVGQEVLIKLKSYPFEEYGLIRGTILTISDIPAKGDMLFSRVEISKEGFSGLKENITLRNGMLANAEIITQNVSLLKRMTANLFKSINK